jgi:major membrane immunogen (membrane-anchored lipoprotein)
VKIRKLLFVGLLLSLVLVACGGGDGGDEPVDVVKKAMQAVEKMDLDKAAEYVCEAQKEDFTSSFDLGSGLAGLTGAELDPEKVLDAMTIKMEDMEYEETSKDDDKAVVHMKGTMTIEFDKDKFKDIVKEFAEASGEAVPDEAELDMILGMMEGMLGEGVPVDDDMSLIKEEGKWVICE